MEKVLEEGACVIGGCCGTTPDHIRAMTRMADRRPVHPPAAKEDTIVSSASMDSFFPFTELIIGFPL